MFLKFTSSTSSQVLIEFCFDGRNFVVQNLKVPLRPYKLHAVKEDHGPFLYTPIAIGSLDRKKTKNNNKLGER